MVGEAFADTVEVVLESDKEELEDRVLGELGEDADGVVPVEGPADCAEDVVEDCDMLVLVEEVSSVEPADCIDSVDDMLDMEAEMVDDSSSISIVAVRE